MERLRPGWEILDFMSSWVSHLPKEVYRKVVGHGLNAEELANNLRLDYFFVKDLNQVQELEMDTCSFDAVLCTVGEQYAQLVSSIANCLRRGLPFAEVFRVLKPGGVFIVCFSNWLLYKKAIKREGSDYSRAQLVVEYFQCVEGFTQPEIITKLRGSGHRDKLLLGMVMKLVGILMSGLVPSMQLQLTRISNQNMNE